MEQHLMELDADEMEIDHGVMVTTIESIYQHKIRSDECSDICGESREPLPDLVLKWLTIACGTLDKAFELGKQFYDRLMSYDGVDPLVRTFLEFLQEKRSLRELNFYLYVQSAVKVIGCH